MPLLTDAAPLRLPGSGPAVLLLHGFAGHPASMKPWARHLHEEGGHAVSVPRLPGHGTTWQEMNRTGWPDWYAEANRELLNLHATYGEVFVFGQSMGGTLALRLAQEHGRRIAGLVLVNPAMFARRKGRFALPVAKHVIGALPDSTVAIKKPGVDPGGYDRVPLRAAHSMLQGWRTTRDAMNEVTVPTLIFTSVEDRIVDPEDSEWVLERIASRDRQQVFLHDSYHVATLDHDAPTIFAGSQQFMRSRSLVPQ